MKSENLKVIGGFVDFETWCVLIVGLCLIVLYVIVRDVARINKEQDNLFRTYYGGDDED